MLPGVGGTELVVIAIVALIVVGPKDLPMLMRKVGLFLGKMRGMAAEFRASFDEMARQSELDDLRKEVEALRRGQFLDPLRADMSATEREISSGLYDAGAAGSVEPEFSHSWEAPQVSAAEPQAVLAEPAPKPKRRRTTGPVAKAPAEPAPDAVVKPKRVRSAPRKPTP